MYIKVFSCIQVVIIIDPTPRSSFSVGSSVTHHHHHPQHHRIPVLIFGHARVLFWALQMAKAATAKCELVLKVYILKHKSIMPGLCNGEW